MLTLPTVINTRSTGVVRHPVVAFELGFSVPIRISNHTVSWNGKSFQKAGVQATNFKTGKGGIQTGRIEFINDNFVYTGICFAELGTAVSVLGYIFYGDGPFSAGDEIQFFKGEIVRPVKIQETIIYDIATVATAARQMPDYTPGPPDINWLPYPGQTYRWEDENYEVLF